MTKQWIAVELDGTLAITPKVKMGTIGEPVKAMVDRVKKWIKDDQEVRIFTARASSSSQINDVRKWLKNNGLPELPITNVKDADLVELWDDKAIRVERDTGKICSSCASEAKFSASSSGMLFTTDC